MKTALAVRHVPYEGIAGFRAPIEAAGYTIERVDVCDLDYCAFDFVEPDLLILMGGPMGVYETEANPWIACELKRLRARLDADRPTLGVCLGAQMIAAALGARVYPGPVKEVGFAPVDILDPGGPLAPLHGVPVLHWHGDTFDLPAGTERLASNENYANQAFRRGRTLLALQFHPEMGEDARFFEWVETSGDYLRAAGTDEQTLREQHARHGEDAVAGGRVMLERWLANLS